MVNLSAFITSVAFGYMEWGYSLAGLFVGFMVGMTGVGGGSLMTPILIFGFGIQPMLAVGTDLLFAATTKAGGIWSYWRHDVIHWQVVKRLAMGSLTTTILTLWALKVAGVDEGQHNEFITKALGFALVLTSSALFLKGTVAGIMQANVDHPVVNAIYKVRQDEQRKALATIITGGFLGVMVTLSSVGAGALGAAILLFLYPRMKGVEIVATDIAHAVPLTLVAGLGHSTMGTVDWSLLGYLLVGSLPGIYLGSHMGIRLPEHILKPLLAVLLMIIGVKCLL